MVGENGHDQLALFDDMSRFDEMRHEFEVFHKSHPQEFML